MNLPDEVPTYIVEDLLGALRDVAAERADELQSILRIRQIKLVATNDQYESPFTVNPVLSEIRVYLPALKRQLAMAFAYVIVYRAAEQASATGSKRLILNGEQRSQMAVELLKWAMFERVMVARAKEHGHAPPNDSLPAHLSFPESHAPEGSDDVIAIRMFYTALAADLYHELTHLTNNHGTSGSEEAIRQEIEADEGAANWLVGDRTESDPQFSGRMLGLVLSQAYEVFLALEGFTSDSTHPPIVDRLRTAVQRVQNANHSAWAFVSAVLALHLETSNRKKDYDKNREHATFRDMAIYLMELYE